MYTVTTKNSLSFILEGTEQILAFKAKVAVNREEITSLTWHEKFNEWPDLLVRMPGSYLPAWIMAGSYWHEEGWDFVLAKKPKGLTQPLLFDVLVIETSLQRYRRIIIRMSKETAKPVLDWWKNKS